MVEHKLAYQAILFSCMQLLLLLSLVVTEYVPALQLAG